MTTTYERRETTWVSYDMILIKHFHLPRQEMAIVGEREREKERERASAQAKRDMRVFLTGASEATLRPFLVGAPCDANAVCVIGEGEGQGRDERLCLCVCVCLCMKVNVARRYSAIVEGLAIVVLYTTTGDPSLSS
eukprot:GHVO01029329.1.p1 GENE.GHVO01029329.1~~GHVO01029329.1.p1  ORF type:complete len:136 (-),score=7.43 GHVO01029329.1:8-415(-)